MTDDEWDGICLLIEECFSGEFADATRGAYRVMLEPKFPPDMIVAGLHKISENGRPFVPKVPEIVAACRSLEQEDAGGEVPGWTEAYRDLLRAVVHGSKGYFDGKETKERKAVAWLEEHSHPVVAAFFRAKTWERMAMTEWDDPEYGGIRRKELREEWEQFVGIARERLASGLALEAVGRRPQLGPARLDRAALLESAGVPRKELAAGG